MAVMIAGTAAVAFTTPVAGVLLALPAGAQDGRDAQAELTELLLLADELPRDEWVRRALRALEGEAFAPPACVAGEEMFDDMPATNPFCPWIEELARRGITGGCGGGNFCPASPVTRAQIAVFIVRALESVPKAPRVYDRVSEEISAADGAINGANAFCEIGDQAIAGGWDVFDAGNGAIVQDTLDSGADQNPPDLPFSNAWRVDVRGFMTGRTVVICLDHTP